MPSAFISYSSKDKEMAENLHLVLEKAGIDIFMAALSIESGMNWSEAIFENLSKATWVFFLATKNFCKSQTVQQELGASLATDKTIIPLLVDISPEKLPGWVDRCQAIDIRKSPELLRATIEKISEKIRVDKFWSGVIFTAVVVFILMALENK